MLGVLGVWLGLDIWHALAVCLGVVTGFPQRCAALGATGELGLMPPAVTDVPIVRTSLLKAPFIQQLYWQTDYVVCIHRRQECIDTQLQRSQVDFIRRTFKDMACSQARRYILLKDIQLPRLRETLFHGDEVDEALIARARVAHVWDMYTTLQLLQRALSLTLAHRCPQLRSPFSSPCTYG